MNNTWKTGQGSLITYNNILKIIKVVSMFKEHKIIVGSDSVKFGKEFIFTNAICILNNNEYYDRRFFYLRKKVKDDMYYNMSKKLLRETTESIKIAIDIRNCIKNINMEIHADVNFDPAHLSSKLKSTIVGYVIGCGFPCKIKPDSFVASGIADLYTRKS
jgi:uncharacterized protein